MRVVGAVTVTLACAVAAASPVLAQQTSFDRYCLPTDPGLAEMSGTAFVGDTLYAIGDSGTDERIAELDANCAVAHWIPNPVDPYDVEDMAAWGGDLWLADIGDNNRRRDTVALTRVDPVTGEGDLRRLTYPDGPHDAEALLIGSTGIPFVVTKDSSGRSQIYSPDVPVNELPSPGPTPMSKVGDMTLRETSTPGGPPLFPSSLLVTGGAVSADGRVAAIRTYTDLYLYYDADADLRSALTSGPREQVPLPEQPQGESLAFTPNGDLVIGSEQGISSRAPLPAVQVLRGAAELTTPAPDADAADRGASGVLPVVLGGAAAIVAAVGLAWAVRRLRGRKNWAGERSGR